MFFVLFQLLLNNQINFCAGIFLLMPTSILPAFSFRRTVFVFTIFLFILKEIEKKQTLSNSVVNEEKYRFAPAVFFWIVIFSSHFFFFLIYFLVIDKTLGVLIKLLLNNSRTKKSEKCKKNWVESGHLKTGA